ncbi:ABC transporter permease [Aquamicrobium sp. LC103]|uniref:ABC transporter permease n=1 Tax=Aquamicrobium sp. LC103 TaxID=1120658 RepID=UPI00063EAC38|nr:ABC transporter permease [Aquamicrobium sp. LC103]TKT81185.1 ABC transporter permease [Aquamicrobium sp. LC103]
MSESTVSKPARQDYEQALDQSDRNVAAFEGHEKNIFDRLQHFLHGNPTMVPVIVLIASVIAFGFVAGSNFFSAFNLSLIMQQVSIIGILAAAQSLVILTAGIDLSVGAIMVLMSVIMGSLSVKLGIPTPLAIAIGFAGGALAGFLNGLFVTRFKLPPFIVTLGTWNIFFALTLWLSGAQSIRSQDIDAAAPLLKIFGESFRVGSAQFTYGSVLMVLIFAVLWYMLNRTAWGRHVYAIGDDKEAAELSGIRTNRTLLSVYALAGLVCGLAAWASIGRVGSVSPQSFQEANLQSITAVVIGGISLFGGRGSIIGPLVGALIVGIFNSGLRLAGVDVLWQLFAIGWLTIIAVAIDQWIRKLSS